MTTTVVKSLKTNFTGGNSATLPFFTPSAGAPGYSRRWIIGQQSGADGSAVAAVTPQTGTTSLTQATGANQPVYGLTDGYKVLRLDGVNDTIGATPLAGYKTLTVLVRNTAAAGVAGGIVNAGANIIRRTNETPPRIGVAIGASATTFFTVGATNGWHLMTFVSDGAAGGFYFKGVWTPLVGTVLHTAFTLGLYGASYGAIEFLQGITWDAALVPVQAAANHAAIRAAYPDLTIY